MWVAVGVGVMSLVPMSAGIHFAYTGDLSILVVPIVVLELMFLACIYVLWRGLDGDGGLEGQSRHASARADQFSRPSERATRGAARQQEEGAPAWVGHLAQWWFKGPREPRPR